MISKLSNAYAVSGNETSVINEVLASLNNSLFHITSDKTGNIIAKYTGDKDKPYAVFVAHMDECGVIITDVCDDGYLKFDVIGNVDTLSLVSKRVKSYKTDGVISLKAVHLVDKEDKNKAVNIKYLYIDIGAKSKDEALKYVTKGDLFTFSNKFKTIGDDIIIGKALSRAVSSCVLVDFINGFRGGNQNIICIFSTLKEVGGRGLKTALNTLDKVKYVCVIDSIDASDKIKLNKGPVLGFMMDETSKSLELSQRTRNIADNIQYEYIKDKTNADVIHADIPVILLGFACKNKNTCINMASNKDIEALRCLIKAVASEV